MKFHCPDCSLAGSIDDERVPEQGLYASCPQCKTRFLIKKDVAPACPPGRLEPARPAPGSSAAGQAIAQLQTVTGHDPDPARRRSGAAGKMILAAAVLLVAGIIAAIAIPRSHADPVKDSNTLAINEIRNAKMVVDHYFVINGALPESLEQTDYRPPQLVDIRFAERDGVRYTIVAAHRNGDMEYAMKGNTPAVLARAKGSTGEFLPITPEPAR